MQLLLRKLNPLVRFARYYSKSQMSQDPSKLVSWKFFKDENLWKPVEYSQANAVQTTKLSIVTLNQWFSSFKLYERISQQLLELQQISPDIICLQESKKRFSTINLRCNC